MRNLLTAAALGTAVIARTAVADVTYIGSYTLGVPVGYSVKNVLSVGAGAQAVGQAYNVAAQQYHALLWSAAAPNGIDLNPAGAQSSTANGTTDTQQVGYANYGQANNAMLWTGTAASAVNLNPANFSDSRALGTDGTHQVGDGGAPVYGSSFTQPHAVLWSGTAASAVDLNPKGITFSSAVGTKGSQQVGHGSGTSTGGDNHALLWSGSAGSAVDLNPAGFDLYSYATATSGTQQVGYGADTTATGYANHAFLWSGTAASAIDLNPAGFDESEAFGINGAQQVGYGYGTATSRYNHALLWSGTANSFVDLGALLPSTFTTSYAYSISGTTIYGLAQDANGNVAAVTWAVPEPASISLLAVAGSGILSRRRRA